MKPPALIIFSREQHECEWLAELLFPKYSFISTADFLKSTQLSRENKDVILLLAPSMLRHEIITFAREQLPEIVMIGIASEEKDPEFIIEAYRRGMNKILINPDRETLDLSLKNVTKSEKRGKRIKSFIFKHSPHSYMGRPLRVFSKIKQSDKWLRNRYELRPKTKTSPEEMTGLIPQLTVSFFGNFSLEFNCHPISDINSRKGKAILVYLLFNHKKHNCKDVLMETFWPRVSPESARNSLNVALHSIRKAFHDLAPDRQIIVYKDECYFIHPDLQVNSDVVQFSRFWQRAKLLEQQGKTEEAIHFYEAAFELYAGELIEEDLYSEWAIIERENLREIYLVILDRLSEYYAQHAQTKKAIEFCQTILKIDNCREDVHRRLMNAYYRLGKRDKAIKQFYKCKQVLMEELDVDPSQATCELLKQIKGESFSRISDN